MVKEKQEQGQGQRLGQEHMYFEIQGYSCNEQLARVVTAAFMTRLNPTVEEVSDVKTAVSEAVTNAIVHGYMESGETVRIWLGCEGQTLTVRVEDDGVGIGDIEQARSPMFTSDKEGEHSGMGFTFMEAFMDQVDVESELGKGTTVTMKKKIGACLWTRREN